MANNKIIQVDEETQDIRMSILIDLFEWLMVKRQDLKYFSTGTAIFIENKNRSVIISLSLFSPLEIWANSRDYGSVMSFNEAVAVGMYVYIDDPLMYDKILNYVNNYFQQST